MSYQPPPGPADDPAPQSPYGGASPYSSYPPYGAPGPYGAGPGAPWGVDPATGVPFSDKQKVIAGVLQILIPLGIGRFYMGNAGLGIAQLLVTIFTCGVGALWPFIDGIVILCGRPVDEFGRPLR